MHERLKQIKERLAMLNGEWEAGRGVAVRPDQLTSDIAWLIEQLERRADDELIQNVAMSIASNGSFTIPARTTFPRTV